MNEMRKVFKILIPFLAVCAVVVGFAMLASALGLMFRNSDTQNQLILDVDLVERKLDALQEKLYKEHINTFLQNNTAFYSTIFDDEEVVQIRYDRYVKDPHDGFNTSAVYEFYVCYKYPSPVGCLTSGDNYTPTILFKDYEVIHDFKVEKIKPGFSENPIFVIQIETNILNHLYFYIPQTVENYDAFVYQLINPVTDQGWLRQYDGEKKIVEISETDTSLVIDLDIVPLHYQVEEHRYNVLITSDAKGGYTVEYKY